MLASLAVSKRRLLAREGCEQELVVREKVVSKEKEEKVVEKGEAID